MMESSSDTFYATGYVLIVSLPIPTQNQFHTKKKRCPTKNAKQYTGNTKSKRSGKNLKLGWHI